MHNDNPKYYEIVKIEKESITIDEAGNICVKEESLKSSEHDKLKSITDDKIFRSLLSEEGYYWLSGGGSYLINRRYIPVIRRRRDSIVNPLKISIFTGRSDNYKERLSPSLMTRELFEELLLFVGDKVVYPVNEKYQSIIDKVYRVHEQIRSDIISQEKIEVEIKNLRLTENTIKIGKTIHQDIDVCINKNNDINALSIFSIDLDINIEDLILRDGEHYRERDFVKFANREILLIDIVNNKIIANSESADLTDEMLTCNAKYAIDGVRRAMCL